MLLTKVALGEIVLLGEFVRFSNKSVSDYDQNSSVDWPSLVPTSHRLSLRPAVHIFLSEKSRMMFDQRSLWYRITSAGEHDRRERDTG